MYYMTDADRRLLERLIDDVCRTYDACGMAVAVVDRQGETKYQNFWGYRDGDNKLLIDENTIFGIASVTKSFTSASIMKLQEEGLLNINDRVSDYIPEFTGKNQPDLRIWHLLCHSGGFFPLPRILVGPVAEGLGLTQEKDGDFAYSVPLAKEGIRLVAGRLDEQTISGSGKNGGLIGEPGEYFSYCNDGFGVLSDIVRRVSGEPFPAYVKEHILKPLGMDRSSCEFLSPSLDENAAVLYEKRDGVMCHDRDYCNNAFVIHGGGAMKSTLSDLKKYVAMYLNEGRDLSGKRILSRRSIHEMQRPKITSGPDRYYCCGLVTKPLAGVQVFEHSGDLPGVSSCICFSPDAELGVIVLCNTTDVPATAVAEAAMRAARGQHPEWVRPEYKEISWSEETLSQAAGIYNCGEGYGVEIFRRADGSLGVRADGAERIAVPVGQNQAMLIGRFSDGFIRLFRRDNENGEDEVFALQYGSRMLPKLQ